MVYNNYLNKRICLIGCLVKKEQKTKKRKEKEEVAIFHVNDDILSPERLTYKITFFAGECLTFFLKCFFFDIELIDIIFLFQTMAKSFEVTELPGILFDRTPLFLFCSADEHKCY